MNKAVHDILIEVHTVPNLKEKQRLSDYLPNIFVAIQSKSGVKKAIKKGLVKVNGVAGRTSDYIVGGELIELFESENKKPVLELTLEVLYEDEYLAIINKPAGIVVSGNKYRSVENALAYNISKSKEADTLAGPEPIHRLDYPTSGVLLIGKTKQAVVLLNKLFENKEIEKIYHAITIGEMNTSGSIETPIENKQAKTVYCVNKKDTSQRFKMLNLVELKPSTGRKHQLRIHLSSIGNPILGDKEYGTENLILHGKGLYLHASSLSFKHPFTGQFISIKTPLPPKFTKIFND